VPVGNDNGAASDIANGKNTPKTFGSGADFNDSLFLKRYSPASTGEDTFLSYTHRLFMMHPAAELRYTSDSMGYGLFARKRIGKGTITWTGDELDQRFSEGQLARMNKACREQVVRFSYVDPNGMYVLCWDHGRFVNHSCDANCLSSGFDFEFAIRDIEPGEQICDDYGLMNLTSDMKCECGSPSCRESIGPRDIEKYADRWDELVRDAFPAIAHAQQPLWHLVSDRERIESVLAGKQNPPSCRVHGLRR
jgi:hypothetical protein